MSDGQEAFQARLSNLGAAHQARQYEQTAARDSQRQKPQWIENLGYPASLAGAFVLGLLSVFIARYVTSHINDGATEDPDLTLLMDGAVAFGVVFILRTALHMTSKEHILCKTVGIWVSLTMMHNLVHAYPGAFAVVYTPKWVEYVTTATEPNSIFFRGQSFYFGDGPAYGTAQSSDTPGGKIKINRF